MITLQPAEDAISANFEDLYSASKTIVSFLNEDSAFKADYPRQIGILSAGDDSGITFAVVGTDPDGKAQIDTITGSSAAPGTTESVLYFDTIASITASGAAAGNVSVGTVDEFVTNCIPIEVSNKLINATLKMEIIFGPITLVVEKNFYIFIKTLLFRYN